jgi:hypothetical protein
MYFAAAFVNSTLLLGRQNAERGDMYSLTFVHINHSQEPDGTRILLAWLTQYTLSDPSTMQK